MCFLPSKNSYGRQPHKPTKKTKSVLHKHKTRHTRLSFIQLPFGFLSAFAGEMLIKNHSYAKAASYYHQSAFISLPGQQFFISCSFSSAGSFQQASYSLPSFGWLFCLSSYLRLVPVVFPIRSPSTLCIALLGFYTFILTLMYFDHKPTIRQG